MSRAVFDKPVQTRSEETGLNYFDTVQEALDAAKKDSTIWKISFKLGNERLRLVKREIEFVMHPSSFEWVLEGTQGALPEISNARQIKIDHSEKPDYSGEVTLTSDALQELTEEAQDLGMYETNLTRDEQDNAERAINDEEAVNRIKQYGFCKPQGRRLGTLDWRIYSLI